MKIEVFKKVVKVMVEKNVKTPVVAVGVAGIGKTQTVLDVAKELELPCSVLRIGSKQDVGDLLGMPRIVRKDDGTEVTEYAPPVWYTTIQNGGILFLDELNRCKPLLQDAVMQILDQRRFDVYVLPDNVTIIGAMNPQTEDYDVSDFDIALVDRIVAISVENEPNSVLSYAIGHNWPQDVIDLIAYGSYDMVLTGKCPLPPKQFTPRGLRQLVDLWPVIEDVPEAADEIVIGCIGPKGFEKWKYKEVYKKVPTAEKYFENPDQYPLSKFDRTEQMILIGRVVAYVRQKKTISSQERRVISNLCAEVEEPVLAVLLRIAATDPKVCSAIDFSDSRFAEKAKKIMEVLNK